MVEIDRDVFDSLKERMKAKFPVLLEGYIRDAKAYLVTIETNLPDGSLTDVIGSAHSLKSASGLLGIMQVHTHAERLEYAAKALQDDGAARFHSLDSLCAALQSSFSEVEGDLRTELERVRAS